MTPERHAEADQAAVDFQYALAQLGVETIEDALILWDGVPPTRQAATSAAWLRRAIRLVMTRRARARDLAMAYYRLVRALRTGRTIADPYVPEPRYVTITKLREEFATLAPPVAEHPTERLETTTPPTDTPEPSGAPESDEDEPEEPEPGELRDDELDRILVEEIEGLKAEAERIEREAEEEARLMLETLGLNNLSKKLRDVDPDAPASEADEVRDEAHRKAGTRQAAAAERVAMNGARSAIWAASERDKRVLGYIRLSRTGTPCGWCAMLISRGPVYKSEQSASRVIYGDGDLYHDNCHCYAEPVFSREQYASSDLYALNREYGELWPKVTAGLSGKAALSAWRRYIRQEQKKAAQAAA